MFQTFAGRFESLPEDSNSDEREPDFIGRLKFLLKFRILFAVLGYTCYLSWNFSGFQKIEIRLLSLFGEVYPKLLSLIVEFCYEH